jgi:putative heme-binding domain-containing protein
VLLEALETKEVARIELEAAREDRLRKHADPLVRPMAAKLLTTSTPGDRKQVLAEYQSCLEMAADPRAGRELFRQHCSTCHRIGDLGVNVAPDISDSRVKTPAQLLTDILNPNQAIDNNYVSYTVTTSGGQSHVGVISSETATSLLLRQAEDKSVTLLRSDIESIRSNGTSLMPEGFEKTLSRQQVADVISFVKNWRYLDPASGTTIGVSGK